MAGRTDSRYEDDADWDPALGPVVLRCRPLSVLEWNAIVGFGRWYMYIGLPLLIAVLSFYLSLPAILLMQGLPPEQIRLAILPWFLFCYAALVWFVYFYPTRDHLVLHEQGFRCRIVFTRGTFLFAELDRLWLGFDLSRLVRAALAVNAVTHPGFNAWFDEMNKSALTVHRKDGRTVAYKTFTLRFGRRCSLP
jgi:hypothetical protein